MGVSGLQADPPSLRSAPYPITPSPPPTTPPLQVIDVLLEQLVTATDADKRMHVSELLLSLLDMSAADSPFGKKLTSSTTAEALVACAVPQPPGGDSSASVATAAMDQDASMTAALGVLETLVLQYSDEHRMLAASLASLAADQDVHLDTRDSMADILSPTGGESTALEDAMAAAAAAADELGDGEGGKEGGSAASTDDGPVAGASLDAMTTPPDEVIVVLVNTVSRIGAYLRSHADDTRTVAFQSKDQVGGFRVWCWVWLVGVGVGVGVPLRHVHRLWPSHPPRLHASTVSPLLSSLFSLLSSLFSLFPQHVPHNSPPSRSHVWA